MRKVISRRKCGACVQSDHQPSVATVVVFEKSLSTVPYTNAGTTPPNRVDLVMHSSEISTDKAFELAENWSSNIPPLVPESDCVPDPALNRITNPFGVVPDLTSASGTKTNAPPTQAPVLTGTEVGAKIGKSPSH